MAAIVTSDRGMLITKRVDRDPPWGFVTGEQDAVKDENPKDTAVREAKRRSGFGSWPVTRSADACTRSLTG